MSDYAKLVQSLSRDDILSKWPEVTPLKQISGTPTSAESSSTVDSQLFEGHDKEQIKLMEELCIVLDYNDTPVGAGTKKACHIMDNINAGLLHRAFSVFLFNEDNKLLLQQRADEKITFPNMWTNTCCSHPLCFPSELGLEASESTGNLNDLQTAVAGSKIAAQRKLFHELGIPAKDCPIDKFEFLTRIHYKSASGDESSKWGEHEIDYILILKTSNSITIDANYNEVRDFKYVSKQELKDMFNDETLVFTPWFKLICETSLFKWWDNLDNLSEFSDTEIHRLL
ncbi:putative isopentenyl-diphosphate Delta-isomerase [Clavispora lusitaniae]|uniref:Isopentenyl-diphosphate Delta-isomerase n=1 Tax=Clavispora lusitaniae TaxID=36911 RepID=A0ACD0WQM7_CLALS|nr:putative isopentenyl-diphosphate Delta-isomerase [Clavispora lusitaniae]QFZ35350.1 putative isopentenyl-diphosphate Delta-isomerase [Clavispora lusitaniae]QFZ41044.1 putative isopentenyl-diphosphate Delta-isomerase [Clavispora lusitaniae]QFZ46725.1 putative isopentenyl-diphosphate Delta-isomerase [Clavispora lusitaniae]QFZ52390.1 putative isopentenyl-diphosphate Delta-isomerase [Clavispora lusitaniae]